MSQSRSPDIERTGSLCATVSVPTHLISFPHSHRRGRAIPAVIEEEKSFLTRYRSSHNGNFPSLNLTHKEVGGSFYTVREIVRDVIQENKVLGPGSLNLKALNLEDCSNPPTYLTAGSNVHEEDHKNMDLSPIADMNHGEVYGLVNHESWGIVVGDPNDVPVLQSLLDKSSDHLQMNILNHVHQYGNLVDAECKGTNSGKLSGLAHDDLAVYKLDSSELQSDLENCRTQMADQSLPLHHSLSDTYQSKTLELNDNDHENGINHVDDGIDVSAESCDFSQTNRTDVSAEGMVLPALLNSNTSNQLTEGSLSYSTFATSVSKNCNSHLIPLETEKLCSSQDVSEVRQTEDELEVLSMPVNQNPIVNRTESTVILSSSSVDEEAKGPTSLMPEVFVSPPSETLKTEDLVEAQPNGMENIIKEGQNKCHESIDSTLKEVCATEGKAELEGDSGNIARTSRESTDDKQEKTETNPVWEALKSLVNAFIKFWSE
ncbi:uncharacterized protein [Typha latifolia]|uniref:uncharacterized protein isoform X2 n=1 Tax=Typha latifolia TaxID=4733 RepID=UPI003C2B2C01